MASVYGTIPWPATSLKFRVVPLSPSHIFFPSSSASITTEPATRGTTSFAGPAVAGAAEDNATATGALRAAAVDDATGAARADGVRPHAPPGSTESPKITRIASPSSDLTAASCSRSTSRWR